MADAAFWTLVAASLAWSAWRIWRFWMNLEELDMADSLTTKIAALKACAVQSLQTCTSCDEYDTADCSACITARGCLLLLDVAELTADYCCCEGEDLNRTTACQTALDALERGLPGGERR